MPSVMTDVEPILSQGAWRDGSKEWRDNPTAKAELNYEFDPNDGLFWISKQDAFRHYQACIAAAYIVMEYIVKTYMVMADMIMAHDAF